MTSENVSIKSYLDITKAIFLDGTKTMYESSKLHILGLNKNRLDKYYSLKIKDAEKLKFTMASRENVTNYDCGKYLPEKGSFSCENHIRESIIHHKKDCNKLGCPMCYDSASIRRAKKIASRLIGISVSAYKKGWNLGRANHISINPQKNIHLKNYTEFKELKKEGIKFIKWLGSVGGVIMAHPLRIDEINEELYESHHLHAISYGFLKKSGTFGYDIILETYRLLNESEIKDFPGITWRYQNHGKVNDRKNMEKLSSYMLSHVGLWFETKYRKRRRDLKEKLKEKIKESSGPERKFLQEKLKEYKYAKLTKQHHKAYSYYGICAPCVSNLEKVVEKEVPSECPVCENKMFKIKSGVLVPLINNQKNEKDLAKLGFKPKLKYLEIGHKIDPCNCELCSSHKNKDNIENAKNVYADHYGVDKWRPVIIMDKVEFDKENWLMDKWEKNYYIFRYPEKIKELFEKNNIEKISSG